MAVARKEHLVETALDLFAKHGFHATGIDRILAEAGVAKMTLYKHFRSKDELILATLRRRDEQWRNAFGRAVEGKAKAPKKRLLAVFDVLDEWFEQKDFRGCLFINAAAEYGDRKDPIHAAAAEHKKLFRDYLAGLARDAGFSAGDDVGGQLSLLVEGAIVGAHVEGDDKAAKRARKAAKVLLKSAGG